MAKPVINDDIRWMWNYFKGKFGSEVGAAAMMGCLFWRSGIDPRYLDRKWRKKNECSSADEYVASVDAGTYNFHDFAHDGAGFGIARWTVWTSKQSLYNFAKHARKSIADFELQTAYIWDELSGLTYEFVRGKLMNAGDSFKDACRITMTGYIQPRANEEQMEHIVEQAEEYAILYYSQLHEWTKEEAQKPEEQDYFEHNKMVPRHVVIIKAPTVSIKKRPRGLFGRIKVAMYDERYPFIEYSEDCKWLSVLVMKDDKPVIGWVKDKDSLVLTEIVPEEKKIASDKAIKEALG